MNTCVIRKLWFVLMLCTIFSCPVNADLNQAISAYQSGDYQFARKELTGLEKGNPVAQGILADIYFNGQGVTKNFQEARKWYQASAEGGVAESQTQLAIMMMNGAGGPIDQEQAITWFERSAAQGELSALHNLGVSYYFGRGVEADYLKALPYFKKAAENGHPSSQFSLYRVYQSGKGVKPNPKVAKFWLRTAAERGLTSAQFELAKLLEPEKTSVREEDDRWREARRWYTRAAVKGHADAQIRLGQLELDGVGGPVKTEEGLRWVRTAAEGGAGHAMFLLGMIYEEGKRDIEQDLAEAYKWYFNGAARGEAAACLKLSKIYSEGLGVEANPFRELVWLRLAAKAVDLDDGLIGMMNVMSGWEMRKQALSEKEIDEIEKGANAWIEKYWSHLNLTSQ